MSKILTIQLPDHLQERLGLPAGTTDAALEAVIMQTLQTLANLVQHLQDSDPALRARAAQSLETLGTGAGISALVQLLHDPDGTVSQAAMQALQQISSESALATLTSELSTELASQSAIDSLASLIGTLDLGTTDLAENHDHYLTEALEFNSGE